MNTDPYQIEGNRAAQFTKTRRDRCVKQIMQETGIDEWSATVAYRIATKGLRGKETEQNEN